MPCLDQTSSGTTVLHCKNEKKREGWWLATINHAQLSGFISNLLPSLGKLVDGYGFYMTAVRLVTYTTNQACKLELKLY